MQSGAVQTNDDDVITNLALGAPRQNFGRGLYLLPARVESQRHRWRIDYQFKGKRKTLSLGVYPEVGVNAAQDKAGTIRQLIVDGVDPSKERRKKKQRSVPRPLKSGIPQAGSTAESAARGTFKDVAQRWYAGKLEGWTSSYADKVLGRLKNHLYPQLGRRPIGELEPIELLDVCQAVQNTGTIETARRVCKIASGVLSLAVVEGWAERNFYKEVLDQLRLPIKRNFAAITDPRKLADLLRSIDNYHGTFVVKSALQLVPMLMLRPGALHQALWSHIDLENGIMIVPVDRLKLPLEERETAEDHVVPLARQAVAILAELLPLTGRTGVVFPCAGPKGTFISGNTLNKALRIMGYCTQEDVTAHGFRATARTMLVERLKWEVRYAEMQLAHVVPDLNGTAYNRAEYKDDRVRMMQEWADYLDGLRAGTVAFKQTLRERFTPVTQLSHVVL